MGEVSPLPPFYCADLTARKSQGFLLRELEMAGGELVCDGLCLHSRITGDAWSRTASNTEPKPVCF